jgi:hypothetical protein
MVRGEKTGHGLWVVRLQTVALTTIEPHRGQMEANVIDLGRSRSWRWRAIGASKVLWLPWENLQDSFLLFDIGLGRIGRTPYPASRLNSRLRNGEVEAQ